MRAPPVLVVVVSYNTRDLLDACLSCLRGDAESALAEVAVVDNASTDGSAELVRDRHRWVTLHASTENLGFGPAVNLAASAAGAREWIAPANADTAVEPDALATMVAAGRADPGCGVVAPRLILPDGSTQHSVYAFPTIRFTLGFHARLGDRRPEWGDENCLPGRWDAERPRRVPWAVGAFLLVRGTAWAEVGGFDDRQWMYAEDLDLAWRLARAGWATRYEPDARVNHHESAAAAAAWGEEGRADRWNRATYEWMLRRRGRLRTRTFAAANVAGHAARMLSARRDPAAEDEAALHRAWMRRHALGLRLRLPRDQAG